MIIKSSAGRFGQNTYTKLEEWGPEIQSAIGFQPPMGAAGGSVINLGDAYPVAYLTLDNIKSGNLLGSESKVRWRQLLMYGADVPAEIELDESEDIIALHTGEVKKGLKTALDYAENLPDSYEAKVLTAPALRFIALWLHNDSQDLLIPYPPDRTGFERYKPVSVEQVLKVLQSKAEQVSKVSAGSEPTGG